MRANEFITENPIGELSTWLQKQSIGRKMKDRSKAQKAKLPLIAKQVQKLLASRVAQIATSNVEDKQQALVDEVKSIMARSTKVDIEGNSGLFNDSMDSLIDAIIADPNGVASSKHVRAFISDVVNKSFSVKMTGQASLEQFNKFFQAGRRDGLSDEDAAKNAAEKSGYDPADIDTSTMPTGTQTNTTASGVDIAELVEKIKDHMIENPSKFTNRDTAAEFVEYQLEINKLENNEERDAIIDQLMNDEDMPFKLELGGEFRALVYSPSGTRYKQGDDADNIAFVRKDSKWSQWEIGPRSNWRFMKRVTSKRDLSGLITLAKQATSDMTPLTFRQDDTEGQTNLYRVSAR